MINVDLVTAHETLINYRSKSVSVGSMAPNDICKFLTNLGYSQGEVEQNGWDVDFWIKYTKDDTVITHSGNWFYGTGNLSIASN